MSYKIAWLSIFKLFSVFTGSFFTSEILLTALVTFNLGEIDNDAAWMFPLPYLYFEYSILLLG